MQFPLILLTEVRLREGKALGGEEGKVLRSGFFVGKGKNDDHMQKSPAQFLGA
jgi:hypothetical protein